ncbi:MAG: HlyC/CorC family transporter [Candidatus Aminicenantes bacterium]|nr:HlyC/CorC family transporter [Candidatus Aminicenantes bacterium]
MLVLYLIIFFVLILFSAFFSSAETSLLSLNKIKLNLKANKKNKKAIFLNKLLAEPDEFFSTILIGNNLVNIAAASISAILFAKIFAGSEQLALLATTLATTIIILIFAEVIPKSYAFRHSEKMSFIYAYPIKFFTYLFFPFVKVLSALSNLLFRKKGSAGDKKELNIEEIKHLLSSETKLFHYIPETLRMLHELIDTAEKDIKSLMKPRPNIIALEENSDIAGLKKIIREKGVYKIPIYKGTLDNITGIIHTRDIAALLLDKEFKDLNLKEIADKPVFVSEFSSLNYVLKEFKKYDVNIAVVLDEYGTTIGILTLNDIFKEIFGGLNIAQQPIKKVDKHTYFIKGSVPVEEVNARLGIELPVKKEYTIMSGMFIYFFGKFPRVRTKIKIKDYQLIVRQMGKRKVDEIILVIKPH